MRRALLALVLLLAGLTLAYGYAETRRERIYRQLVIQGDAALASGDASRAAALFGDAISQKPEAMLGYLKRGSARQRGADLDAAAADLEMAARLDPTAPRAFELLGDVELARDAADQAAARYAASVSLDDRSPRVLYKLGLAHYLAGRVPEAQEALGRAIDVDSRFAEAHYLLGLCLRELKRPQEAEQSLKRAIALSPALLPAREHLADLYGAQGRRLARVAELEQLLSTDGSPARHVDVARAYAAAGQTLRAVRLLRRTIDLYPYHAEAHLELGRVWLDASEDGRDGTALAGAVEALEHAVSLEGTGPALTELGRAYLAASNVAGAARVFGQAAEILPADPMVFLHLADAAERTGDITAARAALIDHEALLLDEGKRPAIRQRIGDLSMRLRDAATAAAYYARAADVPRPSPALLVRLADACRQAGDMAAARAALARVFEREPHNAAARAVERQLRE